MAIQGAGQIQGGNWQIFDQMLQAANATVHLNTAVNQITKHNGKYRVKSSSKRAKTQTTINDEDFDTVVLAGPVQYSNIDLEDDLLKHIPDEIPYVTLHVTLFTSPRTLSAAYFNHPETEPMPSTILTTLPPNSTAENMKDDSGPAGFFSISTLRTVVNPRTKEKEFLYKIFSPNALTPEFLSGILGTPGKCIIGSN
jgi:prenylcysteine oxidase/farnesylcysteine lyase